MKRIGSAFSRLLDDLVRERVGLASSRRHELAKERVLGEAMKRAGVTDEAVYLALLKRDSKVFDALISDLTVPETYFFRDPPHYELLRREVLPTLARSSGREHVLELWSAGCATGEEPYSLAMLLEQEMLSSRSHVLGTDVSQRALERAQAAVYSRWSMRATSAQDCERYFEPVGREYRLRERIRVRARFEQHSLTSPRYPRPRSRRSGFDLILCRNVLIYFDPAATAATAQKLAASLSHGGWLMLGPSDPLLEIEEWCDPVVTPCGVLYRRRGIQAEKPAKRPQAVSSAPAPPPVARPEPRRETPSSSSEPQGQYVGSQAERSSELSPFEQVRALLREHGVAAAESACRDELLRQPLSAPLHLLHAMLLVDLGRDPDAEGALRRAVYLDRSLLIAAMLSATLRERRGNHAEAARDYELLAQQARGLPAHEPVLLGDGLTHGTLAELAELRARALKTRGRA
ncbi:MAG: methyltransferase, CheR-type [Myxococcaceae bacterium]|nr:methyltransferase, CheR-type [Myxococcaceae bacterium]